MLWPKRMQCVALIAFVCALRGGSAFRVDLFEFRLTEEQPFERFVPIYGQRDAPHMPGIPLSLEAFVRFDLQLSSNIDTPTNIRVSVVAEQQEHIAEACSRGALYQIPNSSSPISVRYDSLINEYATYRILIKVCSTNKATITVNSGYVNVQNPFGALTVGEVGYLPFYLWMSVFFGVVTALWNIFLIYYRGELVSLQKYLDVLLTITFFEMILWYFVWTYENTHPESIGIWVSVATFMTSFRAMIFRVQLLMIAMGFGFVRSSITARQSGQLSAFSFAYFLTAILVSWTVEPHASSLDVDAFSQFRAWSVLQMFLEAAFLAWLLSNLVHTMKALRGKSVKYGLYRNFATVLVVYACLLITLVIARVLSIVFIKDVESSPQAWFLDNGAMTILYTLFFMSILFLWRPSLNRSYEQYAVVEHEEDIDDEVTPVDFADTYSTMSEAQHAACGVFCPPCYIWRHIWTSDDTDCRSFFACLLCCWCYSCWLCVYHDSEEDAKRERAREMARRRRERQENANENGDRDANGAGGVGMYSDGPDDLAAAAEAGGKGSNDFDDLELDVMDEKDQFSIGDDEDFDVELNDSDDGMA